MQEATLSLRGARQLTERVRQVSRPLARQLGFRMVVRAAKS